MVSFKRLWGVGDEVESFTRSLQAKLGGEVLVACHLYTHVVVVVVGGHFSTGDFG